METDFFEHKVDHFDDSTSRVVPDKQVSSFLLMQSGQSRFVKGCYPMHRLCFYYMLKSCSLIHTFNAISVEDIVQVLLLFCIESLESDRILLYSERHAFLRVLPVLVVLATSSAKEGDMVFKKLKINRLIRIFRVSLIIYSRIGQWAQDCSYRRFVGSRLHEIGGNCGSGIAVLITVSIALFMVFLSDSCLFLVVIHRETQ